MSAMGSIFINLNSIISIISIIVVLEDLYNAVIDICQENWLESK